MTIYEKIVDAENDLIEYWGEDGKKVIEAAFCDKKENMTYDEFLSHCTACGGNWGGMLLSGIKELFPKVWDVIPDDMGMFAWVCLRGTLTLCGVITEEEDAK